MKTHSCLPALALTAAIFATNGCGDAHHSHDHGASGDGHRHASPHGGVAVPLGEHQFHLDVLADTNVGTLQAWVMDAHAESFVRIAAPTLTMSVIVAGQTSVVTLAAQANPATGESVGSTSYFLGQSDALRNRAEFEVVVPSIEIRGATFRDTRFQYSGSAAP